MNKLLEVAPTETKIQILLDLVMATAMDLKEVDYFKELENEEFKTVYKIRKNLPFWLKSMTTEMVESKCYFLDDHTNQKDLKIYLDAGRVFIHKRFQKVG
jgi:hypothetical protein